jgi:hypothetical protein
MYPSTLDYIDLNAVFIALRNPETPFKHRLLIMDVTSCVAQNDGTLFGHTNKSLLLLQVLSKHAHSNVDNIRTYAPPHRSDNLGYAAPVAQIVVLATPTRVAYSCALLKPLKPGPGQ